MDIKSDGNNAESGAENPGNAPNKEMRVVGYNMLALVVYTLLSRIVGDVGLFIEAILLVMHVFVCIIMALSKRSWFWLLSGLMVLIIGISSCVYFLAA